MPNAIATMSIRNDTSSTACSAAYRNPSAISRSPARLRSPPVSGGTDGSFQVAHSVASSATASSR
jgi:hypothetical protein